jgi:hypothetical protein
LLEREGGMPDPADQVAAFGLREIIVFQQHVGVADDHVERRAQVVRDARHQLVLEAVGVDRLLVEALQLAGALLDDRLQLPRPSESALGALRSWRSWPITCP